MKLKFARSQKIRVMQGNVGIYTTYGKVVRGQFADTGSFNATIAALAEIQRLREGGDAVVGVCGNFAGRAVQVDLL
jgi:hypothetical protein